MMSRHAMKVMEEKNNKSNFIFMCEENVWHTKQEKQNNNKERKYRKTHTYVDT